MALSLAMALAGYDESDFRGLMNLCRVDALNRRALQNEGDPGAAGRPVSPTGRSESSGISSLILSTLSSTYSTSSSMSAASSRSHTPDSTSPKSEADPLMRGLHKKRDILNLAANLHDSSWNLKIPAMPRYDMKLYMANKSIYHRLSADALEEDYPMRVCLHCGFKEPSPYLF